MLRCPRTLWRVVTAVDLHALASRQAALSARDWTAVAGTQTSFQHLPMTERFSCEERAEAMELEVERRREVEWTYRDIAVEGDADNVQQVEEEAGVDEFTITL